MGIEASHCHSCCQLEGSNEVQISRLPGESLPGFGANANAPEIAQAASVAASASRVDEPPSTKIDAPYAFENNWHGDSDNDGQCAIVPAPVAALPEPPRLPVGEAENNTKDVDNRTVLPPGVVEKLKTPTCQQDPFLVVGIPPGIATWECCLASGFKLKAIKHCAGKKLIVSEVVPNPQHLISGKFVRAGDSIVSVNGVSADADQMLAALASCQSTPTSLTGSSVAIQVWHCPMFEVNLKKNGKLGLRMGTQSYVVQRVVDGGMIANYNTTCDAEYTVVVGDVIQEVNGCKGEPEYLNRQVASTPDGGSLVLKVKRED